jgi:hypothetical protein
VPDPAQLAQRLDGLLATDGLILVSTLVSDGQVPPGRPMTWWYAAPGTDTSACSRRAARPAGARQGWATASFPPTSTCPGEATSRLGPAPAGHADGDVPTEAKNALQAAIAQHQAGRLAEAEALYRRILAGYPRPRTCCTSGLLGHQRGQHVDAVARWTRRARARSRALLLNRGNALPALGRRTRRSPVSGRRWPSTATSPRPTSTWAARQQQGLPTRPSHTAALRLQPQSAEAHYNLGR